MKTAKQYTVSHSLTLKKGFYLYVILQSVTLHTRSWIDWSELAGYMLSFCLLFWGGGYLFLMAYIWTFLFLFSTWSYPHNRHIYIKKIEGKGYICLFKILCDFLFFNVDMLCSWTNIKCHSLPLPQTLKRAKSQNIVFKAPVLHIPSKLQMHMTYLCRACAV